MDGLKNTKDLISFLEENFIPKKVVTKQIKNKKTGEIKIFPSIKLDEIMKLNLTDEQIEQALNYLKESKIEIEELHQEKASETDVYNYYKSHREIINPKTLKQQEEKEKFAILKLTNNPIIREQIIINNIALVPYLAWFYAKKYDLDQKELEQYGYEGLIYAIDNFDLKKEKPFFNYANPCIKAFIQNGVKELNFLKRSEGFIQDAIEQVEELHGETIRDNPKLAEKAANILIKENHISEKHKEDNIRRILLHTATSIDEMLENDEDIISNKKISIEEENTTMKKLIGTILDKLTPRQRRVIELRFGLDGSKKTQEETATIMKISYQRVHQLEHKAINKLRYYTKVIKKEYERINDNESIFIDSGNDYLEETHNTHKKR